jgi:hypothetical protein
MKTYVLLVAAIFSLGQVANATVVWGTAARPRHAVGSDNENIVWGSAVKSRHAVGVKNESQEKTRDARETKIQQKIDLNQKF